MTKEEFNELKKGERFIFRGKTYTVAGLEDYRISPTEHDLYALTTTDGSRVKKQDEIILEFMKLPA
jgi:hypothetical protein